MKALQEGKVSSARTLSGWMLAQGMGVLMVGRTEAAASAATLAVQKALPASCRSCFLAFKVCPYPAMACVSRPSQLCSAAHRDIGCHLFLACRLKKPPSFTSTTVEVALSLPCHDPYAQQVQ